MHADDMPAVLRIQAACYTAIVPESRQSLEAKLRAAPDTCLVAAAPNDAIPDDIAGYLVAMPWRRGAPPELDAPDCRLPQQPDCLYLHDLAVAPAARGSGAAGALVAAFMQRLHAYGLAHASLIAIQASQPFWQRHGFGVVALDAARQAGLAAYGEDIAYMEYAALPAVP
jgi:ribosomal protein S18 acetylase RimI-like enzyme